MQHKKRTFRQRPQRNEYIRFTFHSYGSHFSFYPFRIMEDDRRVNEANWFERIRMLDFYKDEVRMANAKHVYILDNRGNEVSV